MAIDGVIDRRTVLLGAGAACLAPKGAPGAQETPAFASCCRMPDGRYAAAFLDASARLLFTEPLDGRGHDVAVSPDGKMAVAFARRPGRFALVVDVEARRRAQVFVPPPDRHFYGHGFFSTDGRLLLATENDFEAERGCIGLYDATGGFQRIGEFDAGGIGPHEALLLRDGKTIAVANGGIATHPEYPRQKLNLTTMRPSITLIDMATGDLRETAELPPQYHQLSIRHMAETGDGSIWFGGQYEGASSDLVPLVGRYRQGGGIELITAPDALYGDMNNYVGSVAASRDGTRIAVTSPRGGMAVVWDTATLKPVDRRNIADVCGVAPSNSGFLFSDGRGSMHRHDILRSPSLAWDNHLANLDR